MVVAAAPPPPAVIRAAEAIGIEMTHVYGLTETYGPHSVCAWHTDWDDAPLEKRAQLKARQGVPYVVFGTDMRVVDEDMHDVPADGTSVGEVVMRGNNVMLGYYHDPGGHRERLPRRLVPLRRPGGDASGWLYRGARPRQGHHHLRRGEHFLDRSGARVVRASRRAGGGDRRPA